MHIGYLKLYQLQKPKDLSRRYDVILVDEAQDLSPGTVIWNDVLIFMYMHTLLR